MGKKRNRDNNFCDSALMNNRTYLHYYNRLTELAISMFEWKNLPNSVDERFLELTLFSDGVAIFFKDDVLGELALQTTTRGKLNVYRIPTERRAYASNGYNQDLNEENSVLIYNNYLHTNSMWDIEMFAQRLYNLDRIVDVNANAQKTPVLIKCAETERLTMKNAYQQFDGNMPVIYGDRNMNAGAFAVLKTDAPYVADKIYQLKTQIWNEALTYLGISNTNVTKKERMISDEVIRNQGGVIASRYSRLQERRNAVEKINKMFGLDIEVNYRQDYREADDEVMFSGDTGDGSSTVMATDLRTR